MASGGDVSVPAAVTSPIFSSAGIRVGFDSCPPESTYALDVPFRWLHASKHQGIPVTVQFFADPKEEKRKLSFHQP